MSDAWRRRGQAAASGLLLAAAFPGIDQGWVAWFAMVPLLLAMRGLGARRAARLAWVAGFAFFLVTVSWIPHTISSFTSIPAAAAVAILVLMSAAASLGHVLFGLALEWLGGRGIARMAAAPAAWVVAEHARNFLVAEFPWNLLGYSQLFWLPMAQAADLGGVYLLSGVVVLANAALAEAWVARREGVPARARRLAAVAACCPLLLAGYGLARLEWLEGVPYHGSVRVAALQGNIAQDQKWDAALQDRIFATYVRLTQMAAEAGARVVVWPEASLPFYLRQDRRTLELLEVAGQRGIDLLVGAPGYDDHGGHGVEPWNQAWLLRADGGVAGPYDKIQLVPFGEYVPLGGLFGLVDVAVEAVGQLGRGSDFTVFDSVLLSPPAAVADAGASGDSHAGTREDVREDAGGDVRVATAAAPPRPVRLAPLICYEGIFPGLVREFAARGADVLVNISNDAWYGDTSAPWQHLRMAGMRAIENRLPMVRATNTGVSAFFTDTGRQGPTTMLFREEMAMETVLVRDVWSPYRAWGDVLVAACRAALALMAALAWRRGPGAA